MRNKISDLHRLISLESILQLLPLMNLRLKMTSNIGTAEELPSMKDMLAINNDK